MNLAPGIALNASFDDSPHPLTERLWTIERTIEIPATQFKFRRNGVQLLAGEWLTRFRIRFLIAAYSSIEKDMTQRRNVLEDDLLQRLSDC
jgi:hypothetical protein